MKVLTITLLTFGTCSILSAKELPPYEWATVDESNEVSVVKNENYAADYNQSMKITYLTKLLTSQQKSYDDKITFLETELRKTKDRLIEKSLNQEKIEENLKDNYKSEISFLKKELAYKTKSLLEYQRQIEKMKPSEDMKNMIKINTELAAELRKSEDQIAIIQLKQIENARGGARLPASVVSPKK